MNKCIKTRIAKVAEHSSLGTTAIYGDVIDPEERAFAARMCEIKDQVGGRLARAIPALKMRGKNHNCGLPGDRPHKARSISSLRIRLRSRPSKDESGLFF